MVKIIHPSMRRGTDSPRSVQTGETYVVEDSNSLDRKIAEFEGVAEEEPLEETVAVQEQTKPSLDAVKQKPRFAINENIQKTLENLIFIGRHSKVLDLAGHKFEISTLTHREHNHVIEELSHLVDGLDFFSIRLFTLAYALRSIDGKKLDDIELDEEFEDNYSRRLTIVDYLQMSLIEKLWAEYETLVKETNSSVYGENIKNS